MKLDFAPPSIAQTVHLTRLHTWLVACLGLVLFSSAMFKGFYELNKIDENEEMMQRLTLQLNVRDKKKVAHKKSTMPESKITELQASTINNAIAQLNLPWRDVLNAMEAATPVTVALLSLEPNARSNLVKGLAEAKDPGVMVHYIELLKKEGFFSNVFLTMHETNQLDPNKPVRFQFEAHW